MRMPDVLHLAVVVFALPPATSFALPQTEVRTPYGVTLTPPLSVGPRTQLMFEGIEATAYQERTTPGQVKTGRRSFELGADNAPVCQTSNQSPSVAEIQTAINTLNGTDASAHGGDRGRNCGTGPPFSDGSWGPVICQITWSFNCAQIAVCSPQGAFVGCRSLVDNFQNLVDTCASGPYVGGYTYLVGLDNVPYTVFFAEGC